MADPVGLFFELEEEFIVEFVAEGYFGEEDLDEVAKDIGLDIPNFILEVAIGLVIVVVIGLQFVSILLLVEHLQSIILLFILVDSIEELLYQILLQLLLVHGFGFFIKSIFPVLVAQLDEFVEVKTDHQKNVV